VNLRPDLLTFLLKRALAGQILYLRRMPQLPLYKAEFRMEKCNSQDFVGHMYLIGGHDHGLDCRSQGWFVLG
jgi:hypothetical protein